MTRQSSQDARQGRALVLVARPAHEDLARALDRQACVVSFAKSALERGLDIVTTADSDAASLIAQAALPHSIGHRAEHVGSTARVHVAETGGIDAFSRWTLAPFMRRAAITYRSRPNEPLRLATDLDGSYVDDRLTHPFVPWMTEILPTLGLVIVCPTSDDMAMTQQWRRDISVAVFCADSQVAAQALDPTSRLLKLLHTDQFDPDDLLNGGRSHPYGVMSELLLDEWLSRDRRSSDG